jgi:hypothetical protein
MASTVDFSTLNTLQAYYRKYHPEILQKYYAAQKLSNLDSVDLITNVADEYQMTEQEWGELIQPFQSTWTPKSSVAFKAEVIKMRPVKLDKEVIPQDWMNKLENSFRRNSGSNLDQPLESFILDGVFKQLAKDHGRVDVLGVYAAPTAGTAGTSVASYNGLKKVYDKGVVDGKIVPHTYSNNSGDIEANMCEALEELVQSGVSADYRSEDLVIYIDPDYVTRYNAKRRTDFGGNMNYKGEDLMVEFTAAKLQPLRWLTGTGAVMCTVPKNLTVFEYVPDEEKLLTIDKLAQRKVSIYGDWKRAVGFKIIDGLVWGY